MAPQPDPKYILTGSIINRQGEPLAGLIVSAYDQDSMTPENLLNIDAIRRDMHDRRQENHEGE